MARGNPRPPRSSDGFPPSVSVDPSSLSHAPSLPVSPLSDDANIRQPPPFQNSRMSSSSRSQADLQQSRGSSRGGSGGGGGQGQDRLAVAPPPHARGTSAPSGMIPIPSPSSAPPSISRTPSLHSHHHRTLSGDESYPTPGNPNDRLIDSRDRPMQAQQAQMEQQRPMERVSSSEQLDRSQWHRSSAHPMQSPSNGPPLSSQQPYTNGRGSGRGNPYPNPMHAPPPLSSQAPPNNYSPPTPASALTHSTSFHFPHSSSSSHLTDEDPAWHPQLESGNRQRKPSRRQRGDSVNGYGDHRGGGGGVGRERSPNVHDGSGSMDGEEEADSVSDQSDHHVDARDKARRRKKEGLRRSRGGKRGSGVWAVTDYGRWVRAALTLRTLLLLTLLAMVGGIVWVWWTGTMAMPTLASIMRRLSPPSEVTVSFPIVASDPAAVSSRALLMPAAGTVPQGNSSLPVYVIASCSNRLPSLQSCLPTWLAVPEVSSVIIVDWASTAPLHESLHEAIEENAGRLRVVRLEHHMPWELASAVNLALHFIPLEQPSLLLKVDCDTLLLPAFVANHPLTPDMYYAGDWRVARTENELHLNGVLFLHTHNFIAVNGYDERLQSYGYDDTNLHERLSALPLKSEPLRYDYIQHLWHDDSVRAVEEREEDKKRKAKKQLSTAEFNQLDRLTLEPLLAVAPPFFATQRHRVLLDSVPRWTTAMSGAQFTIHKDDESPHVYFTRLAAQIPPLEVTASPDNQTAAINEAAQIGLRRLGFQVDMLTRELYNDSKYLLRLLAFYYTDSEEQSLVVEVQHGLSNRLRALASATAVAADLGLHLKVIWLPDHHCQARFSDLFTLHAELGAIASNLKDLKPVELALQQLRPQLIWEDPAWSPMTHLLSKDKFDLYNYMEQEGGKKDERIPPPAKERSIYVKSAYRLNHDAGLTDTNICAALCSFVLSEGVVRRLNVSAPAGQLLTSKAAQEALPVLSSMIGVHIRHQPPSKEIAELKASEYSRQAWNALAEARMLTDVKVYEGYIKEAIEETPTQRFYVSTDTPSIIEELEKRYGRSVVVYLSSRGCLNRSVECVQHAMADQLLLGGTKKIYGSVWSSFSEMAGLWRMTPVEYPKDVDARVNALASQPAPADALGLDAAPEAALDAAPEAAADAAEATPEFPADKAEEAPAAPAPRQTSKAAKAGGKKAAAVDADVPRAVLGGAEGVEGSDGEKKKVFLDPEMLDQMKAGKTPAIVESRTLSMEDRLNECTIRKLSILGERCSGTVYLQRLLEANFNLSLTHEYHYKHFFGFEDSKHPLKDSKCTLFVGIVRSPVEWLDSMYKYQWQLDQWRYTSWSDFLTKPIISYVESEMNVTLNKLPEAQRVAAHEEKLKHELWHDRNFADPKLPNWKNIFELRTNKLKYMVDTYPAKVEHYVVIRLEDLKPHFREFLTIIQAWFNVKRKKEPYIDAQMEDDILWQQLHGLQKHSHATDAVVDYAWQHLDREVEGRFGYTRFA